jgi:hypothetical protein
MAFQISGTTVIDNNRGLKQYGDTLNAFGNTGTSATLDLSAGNFITATLTGNCTFSFSNPTTNACAFTLVLTNDGTGGRTITWPAAVIWPSGSIPSRTTSANKTDVYTFFTVNSGSTWFGNLAQYNY